MKVIELAELPLIFIAVNLVLVILGSISQAAFILIFNPKMNNSFKLFLWLGTVIHEVSHYIFAKLSLLRDVKLHIYKMDGSNNNYLGDVTFDASQINLYNRIGLYFTGIAPALVGYLIGPLVLFHYIFSLNGFTNSFINIRTSFSDSIEFVFYNLINESSFWMILIMIGVLLILSFNSRLSTPDIKVSLYGSVPIIIIIVGYAIFTYYLLPVIYHESIDFLYLGLHYLIFSITIYMFLYLVMAVIGLVFKIVKSVFY
jgi:hypothetical protein